MDLQLSDDLFIKVERENCFTETKYTFEVNEKSTGKKGTQIITVTEFDHIDFKNDDMINAALKASLEEFWKSYKTIANLDELGEIAYLIPYVLSRFGIVK